jgi:enoyl-CoA hydratase/carnithine racemase
VTTGILVQDDGPVRWITFNRPDAGNAIDGTMATEFKRALLGARIDRNIQAVILTGAPSESEPRHFCAGIARDAGTAAERRALLRTCLSAVLDCPKPLIAAVNGDATGAGALLAFLADQRVAAETANFTLPEIFDNAPNYPALAILRERVGTSLAAELVLSGRPMSAAEARMWNLCLPCAVDDLPKVAGFIARSFAGKPAEAFRLNKAWINGHLRTAVEAAIDQEEQPAPRA